MQCFTYLKISATRRQKKKPSSSRYLFMRSYAEAFEKSKPPRFSEERNISNARDMAVKGGSRHEIENMSQKAAGH